MSNIIKADFQGHAVSFTADGWFNATKAAGRFGKRPVDWLRLDETREYLSLLADRFNCEPGALLKTKRGRHDGGTWLHPKVAIAFARWLDRRFEVWCDEQVESILAARHSHQMTLWQQLMALEVEDKSSSVKGRFGSRLMNERKTDLRSIRPRRMALEHAMQPQLSFVA